VKYEERSAQVLALRRDGLTYRQISERLGISLTHAKRCGSAPSYETTLRCSREAKRRRIGTCERCGAATHYGGKKEAARLCVSCNGEYSRERGLSLRGSGPTQQRALALLAAGRTATFTEIADVVGRNFAPLLIGRLLSYGLIERVSRGVYRKAAAR
jgi:hypothetical protein